MKLPKWLKVSALAVVVPMLLMGLANLAGITVVASMAALDAGNFTNYRVVYVVSYYAGGYEGGGMFYNNGVACTPNAGTCIADGASSPNYFRRQYDGAVYPSWFGVKGDARSIANGVVTTGGGSKVTSASYTFTSADIGKIILCYGTGATITDGTYTGYGATNTTISSINAGGAVFATPALHAVASGVRCSFGSNDQVALQAYLDAVATINTGIGIGPTPTPNPYFGTQPQNNMIHLEMGGKPYFVNNTIAFPQMGNARVSGLNLVAGPGLAGGVLFKSNPFSPLYVANIIIEQSLFDCAHVALTCAEIHYVNGYTFRDNYVHGWAGAGSRGLAVLAGAEVWTIDNLHGRPYEYCEVYDTTAMQCVNNAIASIAVGTAIYTSASDGSIINGQVDSADVCMEIDGGASLTIQNLNAECTTAGIFRTAGAGLMRIYGNNLQGKISFPAGCLFTAFRGNIVSAVNNPPSLGAAGAAITIQPASPGFPENDCIITDNMLSLGSFTVTGDITLSATAGSNVLVTSTDADFTQYMVGATIALTDDPSGGSGGFCQVITYVDPNNVRCWVRQAFSGTTFASGDWFLGPSGWEWLGTFGGTENPMGLQFYMSNNVVGQGSYHWPETD